VDAEAKA